MAVANGTTISGNVSDYNNYFRPGSAIQLSLGSIYTSISSFFTATKMDGHSMSIDSRFISLAKPTSAKSYAVDTTSGTIDSGVTNANFNFDYANLKRPSGTAFDLGAYESVGATVSGTTDTIPPIISVYSPSVSTVVAKGSSLSITAKATDNVRVKLISLYVDGISSAKSSSDAISYTWNSTGARIGTHTISISAIDDKNNIGKKVMTFVVK
jgi:hypothetical protein